MRRPRSSVGRAWLTHGLTRLGLAMMLVPALGCAAQRVPPRPSDFPFHGYGAYGFNLHWRLDRQDGTVTAVGLVEVGVAAAEGITEVTLALEGVDANGRVVSRALDSARPMSFSREAAWSFSVRLRPDGREARFEVRVAHVRWRERIGSG